VQRTEIFVAFCGRRQQRCSALEFILGCNYKCIKEIKTVNHGCISNCRTKNCKFSEPKYISMTKEQLVESIAAHYDELNALNKIDNFYDYEGDFIKLWAKMGREVLEKNISTLPGDRRKKNSNRFWGANDSKIPSL
jgi:hypothetical protein